MEKKFKKEIVTNAIDYNYKDGAELEMHEEGDWVSEGKYEYCDVILKDQKGNFWLYNHSRSGSYFSDWYYSIDDEPEEIELIQVEKFTKTIEDWRPVSD